MVHHLTKIVLLVTASSLWAYGDLELQFHNEVDPPVTIDTFAYEYQRDVVVSRLREGVRLFRVDTRDGAKVSEFEYRFDDRAMLISRTGFVRSSPSTRIDYLYRYTYDSAGRLVEYVTENHPRRETYEYDARGRMIRREEIYPDRLGHVYTFEYDDVDNLIRQTEYDQRYKQVDIEEFTYDEHGDLLMSQTVRVENGVRSVKETNRYEYRDGLMVAAHGDHEYESPVSYANELAHDAAGRLIQRLRYTNGKLSGEQRYAYDKRGNQTLFVNKYHGSNWGSEWFGKEEWEYDAQGRLVKNRIYEEVGPERDRYGLSRAAVWSYSPGESQVITYEDDMERIRTETRRYEDGRIVSKTAESRNGRVRQTDFSYSSATGELEAIVVRDQDGAVVESLVFSYGYAGAPE